MIRTSVSAFAFYALKRAQEVMNDSSVESTYDAVSSSTTRSFGWKMLPHPEDLLTMQGILYLSGIGIVVLLALIFLIIKLSARKKKSEKGEGVPVEESATIPQLNLIFDPADETETDTSEFSAAACIGQGLRSYQEDFYWSCERPDERGAFMAVLADGMGGMDNGQESAQMAVEHFSRNFKNVNTEELITTQLRQLAMDANALIYERNESKQAQGGTTLVCVFILDDTLFWISVGDSRIYLMRDGMLALVNEEHELENALYTQVIEEKLTVEDVHAVPQRELRKLTSSLGREALSLIDQNLRPYPLSPGTRILICSDGVSGTLRDDEIASALRMGSPRKCCDAVERGVLMKGKRSQDNYSAVAIYCGNFSREED